MEQLKNTADKVLKAANKKNNGSGTYTPLMFVSLGILLVALVLVISVGAINGNETKKESKRLSIIGSEKFRTGVTINGLDVSGMTLDQAKQALTAIENDMENDVHYTFTHEGNSYEIDSSAFVITFNTESVLNEAMALGRTGGLLSLENNLDYYKTHGISFDISYQLDSTPLIDAINKIAEKIYIAPVNATAKAIVSDDASVSSVIDGYPFQLTDGKNGLAVDTDKLYSTIMAKVAGKEFGEIELPCKTVEPDITIDKLRENLVMRAWFYTSYSKGNGYNRVFNMNKAASMINGTVIAPGEVFSTEGIIGRRTTANGWLDAPAVISGGAATENQPGGGVCQVSTTVYNAVVKADMEIIHRQNHSKASSYVDPGLDATINTDTIDFLWENNTDFNVYVFTWLNRKEEKLYCAVYGQAFPQAFNRIEFSSTFKNTIEPTATVYTKHSSLQNGQWMKRNNAITGSVYESYAYYYKGNTLVDTKFIATSTYRMHPERYYVYEGYVDGTPLDPYKEVITDSDGNWVLKYPPVVPTVPPVTTPVPAP